MKQEFVGERNYDVAVIAATDTKGHGRLGWVNNLTNECVLAKKEFTFETGRNHEHQAAAGSLISAKLFAMVESGEIGKGTNVLLVLPDSLAPRFFEARKAMNDYELKTQEDTENAANAVINRVVKPWMSQYWQEAIGDLVCAYASCLEKGANVGAVKKSELYERELVSTMDNGVLPEDEAIQAGKKITVDKDGNIAETELYKAPYLRAGEYTVIDRSFETSSNGKVLQFSVNRWENTEDRFIPAVIMNLMALNKAVSNALPTVKRMSVMLEA